MARFRGTVEGNRGEASRLGTAGSGLVTDANGWNIGARVSMHARGASERDAVSVSLTNGSGYGAVPHASLTLTEEESGGYALAVSVDGEYIFEGSFDVGGKRIAEVHHDR